MARWYPNLYIDLGGGGIGCPNCKRPWGTMNFFHRDMETNFSSIEEALSVCVRCDGGCWEGPIKDLIEISPFGGWNKILKWWEEATQTKLNDCQIFVPTILDRSVEEFLKEQIDNNLRAIFG